MSSSNRAQDKRCPNCREAMEEGFVIDRHHHTSPGVQEWAEGKPEKSFWTGLKLKGKKRYGVTTFRCPSCGQLQSYAG